MAEQTKEKSPNKKIMIGLGSIIIILLAAFLICINTVKVNNNIYIGYKNLEERLIKDQTSITPVFQFPSLNTYITYAFDTTSVTERSIGEKFVNGIKRENIVIPCTYTVNEEGLTKEIEALNKDAKKAEDAYIDSDTAYFICEEIYGTEVDLNKLLADLNKGVFGVDLEDYYIQPIVLKTDLEEVVEEANKYLNWSCSYTNGKTIQADLTNILIEENKASISTDWLEDAVKEATDSYNTIGDSRSFTTHTGNTVFVSGGTWGSSVDTKEEVEIITDAFLSFKNLADRTPELSADREEIGNTYIEISISDQHVWVYKDGSLLMESDCVTGTKNRNDTPTGIYYLSECIDGKYLRGDDYVTWVNKWMRITNRGHGLHDATWRGSFGGNIYKYNGSHGCINLPKSFAYELFDVAYTGMPVIIY